MYIALAFRGIVRGHPRQCPQTFANITTDIAVDITMDGSVAIRAEDAEVFEVIEALLYAGA